MNNFKNMINNKNHMKNFTVIELIAGLVIITMVIIILIPVFNNHSENSKKEKYIDEVTSIVKEAERLHNDKNYIGLFTKTNNDYYITFNKISNVPIKDAYGYNYNKRESKISFRGDNVIINVKSCKNIGDLNKCYEIVDVNKKDLSTKSITTTLD